VLHDDFGKSLNHVISYVEIDLAKIHLHQRFDQNSLNRFSAKWQPLYVA
jgi:hypothetical protein